MLFGQKLILIGIAGAVGALARYGLAGVVQSAFKMNFPWGTAVVNILGCFLFGLIWSICESRSAIRPEARVIVLTGFLGAFTTFSTFVFETVGLIRDSQLLAACGNLMFQNTVGIVFLFAGMMLGRLI